jgi:hypothetical protein
VEAEKPRMTRIDKAELISYDQVKQILRRALRDTSRIVNLPPLHASKIKVGFITIKNFSAKKTSDRIKVHGMGEVELHILYKNTEMGDIEFNEELPITYSAGFTHRKALLDCEAVARLPQEWASSAAAERRRQPRVSNLLTASHSRP